MDLLTEFGRVIWKDFTEVKTPVYEILVKRKTRSRMKRTVPNLAPTHDYPQL